MFMRGAIKEWNVKDFVDFNRFQISKVTQQSTTSDCHTIIWHSFLYWWHYNILDCSKVTSPWLKEETQPRYGSWQWSGRKKVQIGWTLWSMLWLRWEKFWYNKCNILLIKSSLQIHNFYQQSIDATPTPTIINEGTSSLRFGFLSLQVWL